MSDVTKKEIPVIEGNFGLNINIEAILSISIDYFHTSKICGLFYLLLFNYIKVFFFLLLAEGKKNLPFHGRDVDSADGIVPLTSQSFMISLSVIPWNYSTSMNNM